MKKRSLRWTRRAKMDMFEIGDFIARDDSDAAFNWLQTLRSRARQATQFPQSGQVVPEFGRNDVRQIVHKGYRIVYRVQEESIDVLSVIEGHRLLRIPNREIEPT